MASPLQNRNAKSQPLAGQGMYIPEKVFPPFTNARVPGRDVSIPAHIRPFLDTTHEPTEDSFVLDPKPGARGDVSIADGYYYKLGRLPPVRHPATHRRLSAYSGVELRPELKFSGHQFDEYVFHAVRQGRRFMFRVEKQHTLMGYRYPRGHESTRCRFAQCPIGGAIRPGQTRVCISEFADPRNEILDPYHNAGYTHLYCLEKFCNLPSLLAETDITFLPAIEVARELSFPPALDAAERQACLQWAREARRSWREFKNTYPIAEARPRYRPSIQDRLHYRLDQIREAQKVSNKRPRRDHDGPQVYTYTQGRQNPAPEPAVKGRRPSPPGIPTPASNRHDGPQISQTAPRLPYQLRQPTSYPRTNDSNIPIAAPRNSSSGQVLSGLVQDTPTQPHAEGDGATRPGVEYSSEEIGALIAQDFADFLDSALEELPWQAAVDPLAAGLQEDVRPEQSTQPEKAPQPEQTPELVRAAEPGQTQQAIAVEVPSVTAAQPKFRRSSAPQVSGVSARVRKSLKASRMASRSKRARSTLASKRCTNGDRAR